MTRSVFIFDQSRCFGCAGCVAACARINCLEPAEYYRQLLKIPPHNKKSDTVYLSLACNHCVDAACVRGCPSDALYRDEELGIVRHDSERCLGCRYCQMACPYDAIGWNPEKQVVQKCDLCAARLEENKEPACVEGCFGQALTLREMSGDGEFVGLVKQVAGFEHDTDSNPSIRFVDVHRPDGDRGKED
jgi:anaerobic dimethyl sulfoxide reductase subunit B